MKQALINQFLENLKQAEELLERANRSHVAAQKANGGQSDQRFQREWSEAYHRINALHTKFQMELKGARKAVQVIKRAGLPIAKSTTTAIPGHHDRQMGFKVKSATDGVAIYFQSQGYEACGTFRQLSRDQINQAITALEMAGYKVKFTGYLIEILEYNEQP